MLTTFCLDSVNEMARGVGGDAFRDDAPFQRYFRDMNTVARHAFLDPDTAGETVGRSSDALEADPRELRRLREPTLDGLRFGVRNRHSQRTDFVVASCRR